MAERLAREAQLQAKRREELDALKEQRKERARTSQSANFSGKQKKQQLRARKQRVNARKDEAARLDEDRGEYEQFFANKDDEDELHGHDEDGTVDAAAFREEPDFFARNKDLAGDAGSRLTLTVALGKNNKDAVGKELSSFFVKETKEQIHLRLMEGQQPLRLDRRQTPLLAREIERDPLLDHPKRPKWSYKMSKQKVDENESIMFDKWLTDIHDKYENEKLNHFEHNLEVWRELWRVTERATHIVVVTDIRNPLLHIPPSIYDLVTRDLKKPMVVVLNKVDLVPAGVVELWRNYLAKRFPLCTLLYFSSRSQEVRGDNNISNRRRVLSKKLEVGDASAIKGATSILEACGIESEVAKQVVVELNSISAEDDEQYLDPYAPSIPERTKQVKGRRRAKTKQKGKQALFENDNDEHTTNDQKPPTWCQHCGGDDAAIACMTCGPGGSSNAPAKDKKDALARGYLLCRRCDREEHTEQKGHVRIRLEVSTDGNVEEDGSTSGNGSPKVTIGLIGHPNVGKSSVLNALAGKKIVSVSHTPGHTKRLQTILITPEICICDCPGLVFPFAGVPKYLQELCGLYPYSQIREPYSAVRFLAEHVELEKILDLKPRTQHFDGIDEELEWTPWSICEAYAEKRGYRTDRRGRPDHQRAGSELVRDTVDGIVPLFFLPPNYKGSRVAIESLGNRRGVEDDDGSEEEEADEVEESDDEGKAEDEPTASPQNAKKSAPVNAFSLLDSDSESDSDEDSD